MFVAEGNIKEFTIAVYDIYFERIYATTSTIKGAVAKKKGLNNLLKNAKMGNGFITTIDTIQEAVLPERILKKSIQSEVYSKLTDAMRNNLIRKVSDEELTPCTAYLIFYGDNGNVKKAIKGESKLQNDYPVANAEMLEFFQKLYGGISVHAEFDAINKFLNSRYSAKDLNAILLVSRNGGDILSRPCWKCMEVINEVLKPKVKSLTLVYPVISKFIAIEPLSK